MEGKQFFSQAKSKVVDFFRALEKNSVATGIVVGVASTLALGLIVPDTAKTFVDELRGRRHAKKHRGDKALPESFAAKVDSSRAPAEQEKSR